MKIEYSGKYKSIQNLLWENVPSFAVITGKNGTGKTQLLELINSSIHDNWNTPHPKKIQVLDIFLRKEECIFLKDTDWILQNIESTGLNTIQQERNNLYENLVSHARGIIQSYGNLEESKKRNLYNKDYSFLKEYYDNYLDKIGTLEPGNDYREDFLNSLSDKMVYKLSNQIRNNNIGKTLLSYKLDLIEAKSNEITEEEFIKLNSEKPWVTINKIFKESNLAFELSSPENVSIKDVYNPSLINTVSKEKIPFGDLSSGERVLVSLVFWLFNSGEYNVFPKLLLLDEPDAHLHPSMTKQLIHVLKNVLVEKYNVRVLMTTHSPSTVSLTPEENLYEMILEPPRIIQSTDKKKTIAQLTEGVIIVSDTTKYILVEGKDDKEFYESIYRLLITKGLISSEIPLAFIEGSNKHSVNHWSKGLRAAGLSDIVKGVIDLDNGNPTSDGICRLERYSIENYLLDPILIFSYNRNIPPSLKNIDYKHGEEEKLQLLRNSELQLIANEILKIVETKLTDLKPEEMDLVEIEYYKDIKINLPKWFLNRRGKDLRVLFQSEFGSATVINNQNLILSIKRVGILPLDLIKLFNELQK